MKTSMLSTHWEQLPGPAVKRLQAQKLRAYLENVVLPFSSHYRNEFEDRGLSASSMRSLEDLQRLRMTSKSDLLNTVDRPQRARDFVLIPDRKVLTRRPSTVWQALWHGRSHVADRFDKEYRPIFMTSTTGRSADPIPFVYTAYDLRNLAVTGRRLFEVCGARREMKLLNLFPYAPHLAFWQTHYGGTEFGVFMVSTGGGKFMGTEGNLRMISKIKPDVIIGMPTFIYHVLQQAVEQGVRVEGLKRVVLGGERVADGLKRKLTFLADSVGSPGLEVVATYGFTEAKMAWGQCPVAPDTESSGYHLYPDLGIVEVVDPHSGEQVPDGAPGELVFTPLDSRGSVVLRYRTGDYLDGGLTYDPCPHCGRSVPRLMGSIRRSSEIKELHLDKIKGTLVDFNQLEHVLDDADSIGAWQLELRKQNDDPHEVDELILHVHKTSGLDNERLSRDLQHRFASKTEVHLNRILFHDADEMRVLQGVGVQLKEQKVVDHRARVLTSHPPSMETKSSSGGNGSAAHPSRVLTTLEGHQ